MESNKSGIFDARKFHEDEFYRIVKDYYAEGGLSDPIRMLVKMQTEMITLKANDKDVEGNSIHWDLNIIADDSYIMGLLIRFIAELYETFKKIEGYREKD